MVWHRMVLLRIHFCSLRNIIEFPGDTWVLWLATPPHHKCPNGNQICCTMGYHWYPFLNGAVVLKVFKEQTHICILLQKRVCCALPFFCMMSVGKPTISNCYGADKLPLRVNRYRIGLAISYYKTAHIKYFSKRLRCFHRPVFYVCLVFELDANLQWMSLR